MFRKEEGKRFLDWLAEGFAIVVVICAIAAPVALLSSGTRGGEIALAFVVLFAILAALAWYGAYAGAKEDGRLNRTPQTRSRNTLVGVFFVAWVGWIVANISPIDDVAKFALVGVAMTGFWTLRTLTETVYVIGDVITVQQEGGFHIAKVLDAYYEDVELVLTLLIVDEATVKCPSGVSTARLDEEVASGDFRVVEIDGRTLKSHHPKKIFWDEITDAEQAAFEDFAAG